MVPPLKEQQLQFSIVLQCNNNWLETNQFKNKIIIIITTTIVIKPYQMSPFLGRKGNFINLLVIEAKGIRPFIGLCQVLWKVWCFVGAIGWGNLIQTNGIWFLAIWCGLFGRKEIKTLLRLLRNHWFNYKLYAWELSLIGLGVRALLIVPLL